MLQALNPIAQGRRLAAWVALFVVLLTAVAPAISHTLFRGDAHLTGTAICTSTGMQWVADADTADQLAKAFAFNHCPFCLHSAGHVALPPRPFAYLFLGVGRKQVSTVWQAFFYVHDSRFWAAPRGPPALTLEI